MTATVSIILPTYNRARFLPQALESIRAQTLVDWELVIVDDGSTDNTGEIIGELTAGLSQPVKFIPQANQGPAVARNTGLDHATGKYIAFFDSDDAWLAHHLADCAAALDANPDVDWVYAASRIVNDSDQSTVAENCFYHAPGKPREFLSLKTLKRGELQILDDARAVKSAITDGLFCGLQCSVFRGTFFATRRIPDFRIGEDRILPVGAIKDGVRIGYLDAVHVVYRLHDENSCAGTDNVKKSAAVYEQLEASYSSLLSREDLTKTERNAIRQRIQKELFWHLGYGVYQKSGLNREAQIAFRRGLKYWPWDWRCWKTYAMTKFRGTVSCQ